jgi:hypothetical protein
MPQTTIVAALNGGITVNRVPRPGPRLDRTPVLTSNNLRHRIGASTVITGDPMANCRWEGGAAEEVVLTAFANHWIKVAEAIERGEAVETDDENEPNL